MNISVSHEDLKGEDRLQDVHNYIKLTRILINEGNK